MKKTGIAASATLLALSACGALAQSTVLIEACNAVKNSAKRQECLKAATAAATPPATSAAPPAPAELNKERAVAICENILPGLVSRRAGSEEDTALSTPKELMVQWPADGEKKPVWCAVDRESARVVSLTSNGKVLSGSIITDLENSARQRQEFAAGNHQPFIARAKQAITANFKDPDSAQFRDLYIGGGGLPALCGQVNAKNSYGAYVGFRRFYATGEASLNQVEAAREDYVFNQMWPSMCGEKKANAE